MWMLASGLALGGCMRGAHARAVRLYPGPPVADVVTLVGDIKTVDGFDVPPHARTFELKPGCHAVTNVTYWLGDDINAAMTVHLSERTYSMNMRLGYSYELAIGTTRNTDTARVVVKVVERDHNGHVSHTFAPGQACE